MKNLKRRQAILAVLAGIVGAFQHRSAEGQDRSVNAQGATTTTGRVVLPADNIGVTLEFADEGPARSFADIGWTFVQVKYKGETVKLTAKEIFEALREGR